MKNKKKMECELKTSESKMWKRMSEKNEHIPKYSEYKELNVKLR